jgi:hypothetical protein
MMAWHTPYPAIRAAARLSPIPRDSRLFSFEAMDRRKRKLVKIGHAGGIAWSFGKRQGWEYQCPQGAMNISNTVTRLSPWGRTGATR